MAAPNSIVTPPVGLVIQRLTGPGRLNVISNGGEFTFINSATMGLGAEAVVKSVITTYDTAGRQLARIDSAPVTGEYGAVDLIIGGRRSVPG
ncbi:hypothetical protein [Amycolatopsis palatopharyngis]|uniref:hypothetical protein n=1 Tax=Amycolatopsis palatopharyngis TaxID=187982 RepID=UPI0013BEA014|nr:hypothetical protein [Amycolatopsis palatopharyngis]